jgi:circadian clock protein KaiC
LDALLRGGLPRDRIYLVQGDPGVGKTTLGMQFLLAGIAAKERCMYIALSETRDEIESVVSSHGWDMTGVEVLELSALEQSAGIGSDTSLFEGSDVDLNETTRMILGNIERVKPDRLVFDSLSELRLLAQSALRYRRQILALKQFFGDRKTTVLLLDDRTSEPSDLQLQSLAHGVISLERTAPLYGGDRRQLRINKLRGVRFAGGFHDFKISTGGLEVFPRLVAAHHTATFEAKMISSGSSELDALLGGGIDYGTSTLLMGPAGAGKSSVAIQYALAAASRGENAAVFMFDERISTLYARTRALGLDLATHVEAGRISLQQIDPAEMSSGEFAHCVQEAVEDKHCRVIVIDSLNGYEHSIGDERVLLVQLHELFTYLANCGVATIVVAAQHGLLGQMQSQIDVSYVADTIVLFRYFEAEGRIRKAISIVKKRSGNHENAIRELTLDSRGVQVGRPLEEFSGVLTGVPQYRGSGKELSKGG